MADQMTQRFGRMTMVLGSLLLAGSLGARAEDAADHHGHFMKCAKACTDCQLQCDMCYSHCRGLLAQGKKEHETTSVLCLDCGDCCKLAATLSARSSPLAAEACDCCAKACLKCAAACEKFPDDKHMADCAKSCRTCAASCQEMIQHLKH